MRHFRGSSCLITLFCLTAIHHLTAEEFRFEKEVKAYEQQSIANPLEEGCTMFVGSSTWALWGKQLEEDFSKFKAVNRGFGGSTIPEVLIAMDRIITPYKPAHVLFFCGTNDIASGAEPEKVFENFKTFLEKLRQNNPNVKVYFVSVTYSPVREKFWPKMKQLNNLVHELAENEANITFLDLNVPMKGKEGMWLGDQLHLSRKAQELWIPVISKALEPGFSPKK